EPLFKRATIVGRNAGLIADQKQQASMQGGNRGPLGRPMDRLDRSDGPPVVDGRRIIGRSTKLGEKCVQRARGRLVDVAVHEELETVRQLLLPERDEMRGPVPVHLVV